MSLYRLPEHGPQPVGDLPVVKSRAHGVSASPTSPAARTKHIIRSASPAIADAGLRPRPTPSRSVRRDAVPPPQGCRCSRARRPTECDSEGKVAPAPPPR
jgi:hypothetical protein